MIIVVDIQSLCSRRRQIVNHGIVSISVVIFLLHCFPSSVGAQQQSTPPPGQFPYQFNPSVAAIIIVLIAALFFMGFFSVYIRQCYDISPNGTGNSMRRAGGIGASLRRRAAARGLDQTVIESLPTFPYSEVKELKIGKGALECAVCLNEFDDEEILRLLPKCDHVFHPECIDAWLQSHVTCPVCRSNLAAEPNEATVDENPESIPEPAVVVRENPVVIEEVTIQIDEERIEENDRNRRLEVVDRTRSLNQTRQPPPPVSKSIRGWPFWSKFPRSHSTGHSLVQPGENTDRFTLRLPEEVRKEVMTRALNRTRSVLLPSEGSTRRGYRSGWVSQEGSSRGGIRGENNNGRFSGGGKSDRWIFTKAAPFFSRALSVRSPRVAADGEGSTSSRTPRSGGGPMNVKLPSFKCLEPNAKDDETGLVSADSIKSPVREGGFHQC